MRNSAYKSSLRRVVNEKELVHDILAEMNKSMPRLTDEEFKEFTLYSSRTLDDPDLLGLPISSISLKKLVNLCSDYGFKVKLTIEPDPEYKVEPCSATYNYWGSKSNNNRSEILGDGKSVERATGAACYSCMNRFDFEEENMNPEEWEWIDDDQTALCPKCGIDAVLADDLLSHDRPSHYVLRLLNHMAFGRQYERTYESLEREESKNPHKSS